MQKKRPVNLNLTTIKFPIPAIVSILHRVSGVLVFFLIPFILYLVDQSLKSPQYFIVLQNDFHNPFLLFIVWLFLAGLLFHLIAGIRHLLMDLGWGEDLKAARFSAWCVIVIAIVVILLAGTWLW
jgi:succinate dehydrogenase / fumarate reductase cytochrome b subunit